MQKCSKLSVLLACSWRSWWSFCLC